MCRGATGSPQATTALKMSCLTVSVHLTSQGCQPIGGVLVAVAVTAAMLDLEPAAHMGAL